MRRRTAQRDCRRLWCLRKSGLNAEGCCGDEIIDCSGECGNRQIDECGVCGGDGSSCACTLEVEDEDPFGFGGGSSFEAIIDCAGTCGVSAIVAECGEPMMVAYVDGDGACVERTCAQTDCGMALNGERTCSDVEGWGGDCSKCLSECCALDSFYPGCEALECMARTRTAPASAAEVWSMIAMVFAGAAASKIAVAFAMATTTAAKGATAFNTAE